jgi:Domain of unknown function DUF29
MTILPMESLSTHYEQDETAWLDIMSELAAQGRLAELDCEHLSEYLADMASREAVLADAYAEARQETDDETELPVEAFPEDCAWTLAEMLSDE